MGSRLLTGGVLAVIGLITVKIVMALFGALAGLFSFLFFTVLPIALIGWIALRIVSRLRDRPTRA